MKERKQSKILGLMLAFCMVLTMTISGLGALQVLAVEGDTSPLTKVIVGGVEMYSADDATYYVNGATEAVAEEPANWNAKYENGILTIKNLSVVGAAADHKFAGIYATTALTIDVQGEKLTLTLYYDAKSSYAPQTVSSIFSFRLPAAAATAFYENQTDSIELVLNYQTSIGAMDSGTTSCRMAVKDLQRAYF